MRRLAALLLVLGLILTGAAPSSAQPAADTKFVIANAGYTLAHIADTGEKIDGWTFNLTLEKITYSNHWSNMINFAYGVLKQDVGGNSATLKSFPITFGAKYLFGNPEVFGYVGGAIGVHFTQVRDSTPNSLINGDDAGFTAVLPLGLIWLLTEDTGLNFNYTIAWSKLSEDIFKNDIVQSFNFGIVFPFGP